MARRKRNPITKMYAIFVYKDEQTFDNTYGMGKIVWEGYGEDDPWEKFNQYTFEYVNKFVVLFQIRYSMHHVLAEYWNGKVYYS